MCSPDTIGGEESGDHWEHLTIDSKQHILKMKPQEVAGDGLELQDKGCQPLHKSGGSSRSNQFLQESLEGLHQAINIKTLSGEVPFACQDWKTPWSPNTETGVVGH